MRLTWILKWLDMTIDGIIHTAMGERDMGQVNVLCSQIANNKS